MSIEDSLTRRQILIQRFGNGEASTATNFLQNIYEMIEERLLIEPLSFDDFNLKKLQETIELILNRGFEALNEDITEAMLVFAAKESTFTLTALNINSSVVLLPATEIAIANAVLNEGMDAPIGPGRITPRDALTSFAAKKAAQVKQVINDGIIAGKTTKQVAAEIRDLGRNLHKSQLESLVRTITNHSASQARKAVITENQALFDGEEWVATLDNRTSLICGGRDGRIYPVGQGPYPPAHYNCRSLRIPIFKEEFGLDDATATRPQIGSGGRGTTRATTQFDSWLRRQSADFQDEYFSQFPHGLEKAALFRRGGLGIQQFRSETGVNYTLDQLSELEPQAFVKANIDRP